MSERTFKTDFRCCTMCDDFREVAVSVSTQVANLDAKTEELALCMACLCNMLEAFDAKEVGAEIVARINGRAS